MAIKKQVCVRLPDTLYRRAMADSKSFHFSFSNFIERIVDDFYSRKDGQFCPALEECDAEMDRIAVEARSTDNPFKFSNIEKALEFLHGDHSTGI